MRWGTFWVGISHHQAQYFADISRTVGSDDHGRSGYHLGISAGNFPNLDSSIGMLTTGNQGYSAAPPNVLYNFTSHGQGLKISTLMSIRPTMNDVLSRGKGPARHLDTCTGSRAGGRQM